MIGLFYTFVQFKGQMKSCQSVFPASGSSLGSLSSVHDQLI